MKPESHIATISRIISEKLGLFYPEKRWDDLRNGLLQASPQLGFEYDEPTFSDWLLHEKFSRDQLTILAEQLTIGETYFFREKKILQAFREKIIPELIRQRQGTTRNIRIWSAGCASGEEPYTLALILSEIIPDLTSWNITILATDINQRFLEKAKRGIFTPWSFRETPPDYLTKYFIPSGKDFEIVPEIRKLVTFGQLNLVEGNFPSPHTHTSHMDVIFCRNVLMYFTSEIAKAVGEKFYHSLTGNGWFITSQVELSDELFPLMTKVRYENVFLYRKQTITEFQPEQSGRNNKETVSDRSLPVQPVKTVKPARSPVKKISLKQEEKIADTGIYELEMVRECANKGDLITALQWSDRLLNINRENPEGYYLKGIILQEMEAYTESEQMLKRTLYLDPSHILAHVQLVSVCHKLGKKARAIKHRENVIDLLRPFGDDEIIPGSEGMTAGYLKQLLTQITPEDG